MLIPNLTNIVTFEETKHMFPVCKLQLPEKDLNPMFSNGFPPETVTESPWTRRPRRPRRPRRAAPWRNHRWSSAAASRSRASWGMVRRDGCALALPWWVYRSHWKQQKMTWPFWGHTLPVCLGKIIKWIIIINDRLVRWIIPGKRFQVIYIL